jgi:hypothetical protein
MKFVTIYVEFKICKLVVFASTHIIMWFACKGGLTLCDFLKFFPRPFPLKLYNVVELSSQSLPSTLQRKRIPFQKPRKKVFENFKKLKNTFTQICNMAILFRAKNYYIYICKVFLFKDDQACEELSLLKI